MLDELLELEELAELDELDELVGGGVELEDPPPPHAARPPIVRATRPTWKTRINSSRARMTFCLCVDRAPGLDLSTGRKGAR